MANNPIVNGFMHQWSSVEIRAFGQTFTGVKSISYKTDSDGANIHGTSREVIGQTQGNVTHDGSIELYVDDARRLLTLLGDNYQGKRFDIFVHKDQDGRTYTDKLLGSSLKTIDNSHSEGAEALTEKYDLRILRIKRGGLGGVDLKAVVSAILDLF